MSSRLRRFAPPLLALLVAGCGYSSGVRLPEGHETVGVEYFDNISPEPDIERQLYARLADQVAQMVSAPLVSPKRADLLIQGQILDYRRLLGIISSKNELLESGVVITLEAWLYDPRRGVRLGLPVRLDREVRYMVWVRAEEPGARQIALETIAQELVLDLLNQESYEPMDVEPLLERPPDPRDREHRDDLQ